MNKMKKMMTVAIAAYAAFTAYAGPGTAKKDVGFTTAREAYKAFTASTNDALRIAAYGHVRTLVVAHVDEAAAREELVFLRNMARTLGQEAKCGDVCEIAAGSTNSAVRLVALTWLCDVARGLDADKATALVDKWLAKTDGDVVAQSFLLCRRMEARKKAGDMGGA